MFCVEKGHGFTECVRRQCTFKEYSCERAGPLNICALLLLTHFSISCEKEHEKTNERLGTAQNIFIKKAYSITSPFSPIFGKSILITFLFIKKNHPRD